MNVTFSQHLQLLFPECHALPAASPAWSYLQPIGGLLNLIQPMVFLWRHPCPFLSSQFPPPLADLLVPVKLLPHATAVSDCNEDNGFREGRSLWESPAAPERLDGPTQSELGPLVGLLDHSMNNWMFKWFELVTSMSWYSLVSLTQYILPSYRYVSISLKLYKAVLMSIPTWILNFVFAVTCSQQHQGTFKTWIHFFLYLICVSCRADKNNQ